MRAARTAFRQVGVFVDWNSQLRQTPMEYGDDPIQKCRHALRRIGKLVTKTVCGLDTDSVFRVRMRLYHGWTSGTTQTANRRAFARLPEMLDPDDLFPSSRVLAATDVEFGDRLIDALPNREVAGARIHLPNTLRRQTGGAAPVEKMVDTALAADLLSWARSDPASVALVYSSDDDLVPPVFVAEAWMHPYGGSVHLTRSAGRGDSRFLLLEGLLS